MYQPDQQKQDSSIKTMNQLLRECINRIDERTPNRSAVAERELAKIREMLK